MAPGHRFSHCTFSMYVRDGDVSDVSSGSSARVAWRFDQRAHSAATLEIQRAIRRHVLVSVNELSLEVAVPGPVSTGDVRKSKQLGAGPDDEAETKMRTLATGLKLGGIALVLAPLGCAGFGADESSSGSSPRAERKPDGDSGPATVTVISASPASLTLSAASISPGFTSETLLYTAGLVRTSDVVATTPTVTATPVSGGARILIRGAAVTSGQPRRHHLHGHRRHRRLRTGTEPKVTAAALTPGSKGGAGRLVLVRASLGGWPTRRDTRSPMRHRALTDGYLNLLYRSRRVRRP